MILRKNSCIRILDETYKVLLIIVETHNDVISNSIDV